MPLAGLVTLTWATACIAVEPLPLEPRRSASIAERIRGAGFVYA